MIWVATLRLMCQYTQPYTQQEEDMTERKTVRVQIPADYIEPFEYHKRQTEAAMNVTLTNPQYLNMLVTQTLNTLEKTR